MSSVVNVLEVMVIVWLVKFCDIIFLSIFCYKLKGEILSIEISYKCYFMKCMNCEY